jgi:hypothetical protein
MINFDEELKTKLVFRKLKGYKLSPGPYLINWLLFAAFQTYFVCHGRREVIPGTQEIKQKQRSPIPAKTI